MRFLSYEGGNGIIEGARFGILVAILVNCFGVEMMIYGAIVGAVYKPSAPAPARTVPV